MAKSEVDEKRRRVLEIQAMQERLMVECPHDASTNTLWLCEELLKMLAFLEGMAIPIKIELEVPNTDTFTGYGPPPGRPPRTAGRGGRERSL